MKFWFMAEKLGFRFRVLGCEEIFVGVPSPAAAAAEPDPGPEGEASGEGAGEVELEGRPLEPVPCRRHLRGSPGACGRE